MIKITKQKGEFGMKRTVYEAPVTELFRVELEGTFMSASIYEDGKHQSGVSSSAQEYEQWDGTQGFVSNEKEIIWE
jgi:hypothetical protein